MPGSAAASASETQSPGVTRREFLANILAGLAILGSGAGLVNVGLRFLLPAPGGTGAKAEKLEVASVSDVAEGKAKDFLFGNDPYVLFQVGGQYKALSKKCPHLGCLVKWHEDNHTLVCPCHAGVFDTNGNVVSGPPPKPLPSLKVQVAQGKILVGG